MGSWWFVERGAGLQELALFRKDRGLVVSSLKVARIVVTVCGVVIGFRFPCRGFLGHPRAVPTFVSCRWKIVCFSRFFTHSPFPPFLSIIHFISLCSVTHFSFVQSLTLPFFSITHSPFFSIAHFSPFSQTLTSLLFSNTHFSFFQSRTFPLFFNHSLFHLFFNHSPFLLFSITNFSSFFQSLTLPVFNHSLLSLPFFQSLTCLTSFNHSLFTLFSMSHCSPIFSMSHFSPVNFQVSSLNWREEGRERGDRSVIDPQKRHLLGRFWPAAKTDSILWCKFKFQT